jgi:hypothetical protein
MVSGLAPGRDACAEIVGKSTCGKGATGRNRNPIKPASVIPIVRSVVATGLLIKGAEMFMTTPVIAVSFDAHHQFRHR